MKLAVPWWLPLGKAPEISPQELKHWLDEGRDFQLVDSRTGLEYKGGTIGSARHAPVTELPYSIDRLHLDQNRPVVVLCLSGHRSLPSARLLGSRGYKAYSLKGGIAAWRIAGYHLNPPPENP
jgi:rhodanese-related sulfurtransferase